MATVLPALVQPKKLPVSAAAEMGPAAPSRVERAAADVQSLGTQIAGKQQEQGAFEAQQAELKAEQAAKQAEQRAQAIGAERKAVEESVPFQDLQRVEKEAAQARFEPTQRSIQENAALFSLIGVIGFAIGAGGKQNAMQAMSGLNGMLKGVQEGDMDRYKQEKATFDTNLKALAQKSNLLTAQLKRITELAARDKEKANLELDSLLAQQQADFVKQYKDKYGLPATIKYLEQKQKGAQQMLTLAQQQEARAEQRARDAEAARERTMLAASLRQQAPERATVVMTPEGPKSVYPSELPRLEAGATQVTPMTGRGMSPSGAGGAVQFRYNSAMTNAGNALAIELENAASLPLRSTPPVAAEILTNPAKGVTSAAESFFAQKLTSEDARAMQQIFAGMQRAITTIEASGRPSGATEGAIREFSKAMPRAGDNKINTYLFLAQAKQVMDILVKDLESAGASETQIKQAKEARDRVGSTITWNVKDINNIISKGGPRLVDQRVQEAIQKSKSLSEFGKELKAKPAAPAVASDTGPYTDQEKERRYQEWKARQEAGGTQ